MDEEEVGRLGGWEVVIFFFVIIIIIIIIDHRQIAVCVRPSSPTFTPTGVISYLVPVPITRPPSRITL